MMFPGFRLTELALVFLFNLIEKRDAEHAVSHPHFI